MRNLTFEELKVSKNSEDRKKYWHIVHAMHQAVSDGLKVQKFVFQELGEEELTCVTM